MTRSSENERRRGPQGREGTPEVRAKRTEEADAKSLEQTGPPVARQHRTRALTRPAGLRLPEAFAASLEGSGKAIQFALDRVGWKQRELADYLHVNASLVSKIKQCERQLSMRHVHALAELCEMSPAEFYWRALGVPNPDDPEKKELVDAIDAFIDKKLGGQSDTSRVPCNACPDGFEELLTRIKEHESEIVSKNPYGSECKAFECLNLVLTRVQQELSGLGLDIRVVGLYEQQQNGSLTLLDLQRRNSRSGAKLARLGQFKSEIPVNAVNVAEHAVTLGKFVQSSASLSAESHCFKPAAWSIEDHFEVALPISYPNLRSQVMVAVGTATDEMLNWKHRHCMDLFANTIRIINSRRTDAIVRLMEDSIAGPESLLTCNPRRTREWRLPERGR